MQKEIFLYYWKSLAPPIKLTTISSTNVCCILAVPDTPKAETKYLLIGESDGYESAVTSL